MRVDGPAVRLDGRLGPRRLLGSRRLLGPRRLLVRHVAGCPTCRAEVARRSRMLGLLHQLGDPSAVARPLPVPRRTVLVSGGPPVAGQALAAGGSAPVPPDVGGPEPGDRAHRLAGRAAAMAAAAGAVLGLGTLAVATARHGATADAVLGTAGARVAGAARIGALLT